MTAMIVKPQARHEAARDRPKVPHSAHLRELQMPDGRKLLLDRRCIAFIAEGKPEEFGNKPATVIGFKTLAKAVPVRADYHDLKAWWRGDGANGSDARRRNTDAETILSVLDTARAEAAR